MDKPGAVQVKDEARDSHPEVVYVCVRCEHRLTTDSRYCPYCGYRRRRGHIDQLTGFTVLYVMLLVLAAACFATGFAIYDVLGALGSTLLALGTALGPVSLVGLIYERLLKDSLREAALMSYEEFSETHFQRSLDRLSSHTADVEDLAKRLLHIGNVGLVGAFPERRYAFPYIEEAILSEEKDIFIVGTSFRGLLWPSPGEERLMSLIADRIKEQPEAVKFILTHPAFAHLRQSLEVVQRRETFHIAQEILQTVQILRDAEVPFSQVRFVRATPTVFGLMTSRLMLLNPYPLQRQAFTSLAVLIEARGGENHVYKAFEQSHFRGVWDGNNVDLLKGYDLVSVQKVFDQSLQSMDLCMSKRLIDYSSALS